MDRLGEKAKATCSLTSNASFEPTPPAGVQALAVDALHRRLSLSTSTHIDVHPLTMYQRVEMPGGQHRLARPSCKRIEAQRGPPMDRPVPLRKVIPADQASMGAISLVLEGIEDPMILRMYDHHLVDLVLRCV
jgi:hypothetical protein